MGIIKNYWGVTLLVLAVVVSSCMKENDFVSSYANYGYASVSEQGDAIYVDLESGIRLHFNDESILEFGDDVEHQQRILVNYEVDETISQVEYTVKVLDLADVEEKDLYFMAEDDTSTFKSNYTELNSASIGNGLLNVQVAYMINHEGHNTRLVHKPSYQDEDTKANVKLVLVNEVDGEELDEGDYKAGFDIITFDVRELAGLYSPDEDGNIYFDVTYNPGSIYEETVSGFQYKVYDVD